MKKQPEVRAKTKQNLIEAFWKVFERNTPNKVSIRAIAETAGYNRCTFYDYFTYIDEIFECAENQLIEKIMDHIKNSLENWNSKDLLLKAAESYEKYGYYLNIVLGPKGDPSFINKYKNALRPLMYKEFHLKKDEPKAEIIYEYCLNAIIFSSLHWYNSDKPVSASEFVSLLQELMNKGVMNVAESYREN